MDSNKHKEYTGLGNEVILENIIKMANISKSMVIRIPVIPGFNDDIENITNTSQFVKRNIKKPKIELLPYHMFGIDKYKNLGLDNYIYRYEAPNNEIMKNLEDIVKNCGVEVIKYK